MTVQKLVLGDRVILLIDVVDSAGVAVPLDPVNDTVEVALTRTDGSSLLAPVYDADPAESGANWAAGLVAIEIMPADTINIKVAKLNVEVQVTGVDDNPTSYFCDQPVETKKGLIP